MCFFPRFYEYNCQLKWTHTGTKQLTLGPSPQLKLYSILYYLILHAATALGRELAALSTTQLTSATYRNARKFRIVCVVNFLKLKDERSDLMIRKFSSETYLIFF